MRGMTSQEWTRPGADFRTKQRQVGWMGRGGVRWGGERSVEMWRKRMVAKEKSGTHQVYGEAGGVGEPCEGFAAVVRVVAGVGHVNGRCVR